MSGARKPLAALLILSMLSMLPACAGARMPAADERRNDSAEIGSEAPKSYAEAVETSTPAPADGDARLLKRSAVAAAHRGSPYRDRYDAHHHREPSPEAQYAAEIMFLVTAQVFVCSFVVVILDGYCDIGVSAGYPYY